MVWNQERPNEMWIGYREKPNEVLIKDPSLLSPRARGYAHYPGGHPEAYPDGLKNFLLRVYSYIAGASTAIDFRDRKSTRLNSSHQIISYAVFCLKKKKI